MKAQFRQQVELLFAHGGLGVMALPVVTGLDVLVGSVEGLLINISGVHATCGHDLLRQADVGGIAGDK